MGAVVREKTLTLSQTNRRLQEERAKDSALMASIGEGIIAVDSYRRIMFINPAAMSLLGVQQLPVVGKDVDLYQQFVKSDGQALTPADHPLSKVETSGNGISLDGNADLYIKNYAGRLVPIALTATPIKVGKNVIGTIEILRDVAKEKEIDKTKSELISLASHQLRTPLSAINWYVEVLLKNELGNLNPEQRSYVEEVYKANKKMLELVYDFLNVSRMELGTFAMKLSAIDLPDVLHGVVDELMPAIKQKNIRFTRELRGLTQPIIADKKIVRIILQNLLSNAVKYTPANGTVAICVQGKPLKDKNSTLIIEVDDTGFGIPKRQQSKIFTKLFRADNAARLETEGTGLGLYIVKSFVDFCHGTIWFKSVENRGSKFHVELPIAQA